MQIDISMTSFKIIEDDIFFYHWNARPSDDILQLIDQEKQSITYQLYGEFIQYKINYRNSILLSDLICLQEKLEQRGEIQYFIEVKRLINNDLCLDKNQNLQSLNEFNILLVETNQFATYQCGFKLINLGSYITHAEENILEKINRITENKPIQKINQALFPYLKKKQTYSLQQFEQDVAKLRVITDGQENIGTFQLKEQIKKETICHQYFLYVQYVSQKVNLNSIASIMNQYWINIEQYNLTTFQKFLIYAVQFSMRNTEQLKIIYNHLKTILPQLQGTNDYYQTLTLLTQINLSRQLSKDQLIIIIEILRNEQLTFFPKQEAVLNLLEKKINFKKDESYYLENQQSEMMSLYQKCENEFYKQVKEFQFIKDILSCEFVNNCQNISLNTYFNDHYQQLRQIIYDKYCIQLIKIEKIIQQISQAEIQQDSLMQYTLIKNEFRNSLLITLKEMLNLQIISELDITQDEQENKFIQQFRQSLQFKTLNQVSKYFYYQIIKLEEEVEQLISNWILKFTQNNQLDSQIQQWLIDNQVREKIFAKLYSIWSPNMQLSEIETILMNFDNQLREAIQIMQFQVEINLDEEEIEELQKLVSLYTQELTQYQNLQQLKKFIRDQQISYLKIESNKLTECLKNYLNNLQPKIIDDNDLNKIEKQIRSIQLSLTLPLSKFCEEQEQQMLYLTSLAQVKIKFYELFWMKQGEKKIIQVYQQFTKFDLSQFKIKLKVYFSDQELSQANISNLDKSLTISKIKIINKNNQPHKQSKIKIIKLVKNQQTKIYPENQFYLYNLQEQEYLNRKEINLYKFQRQSIYQNHYCNSNLEVEEFFKTKYSDLIIQNQLENKDLIAELESFYVNHAYPLISSLQFQYQLENYSYIMKCFKCILKNQFVALIDQKTYEELKAQSEGVEDRLKSQLLKIVSTQQEKITLQYGKKIDLFLQEFQEFYLNWQVKQEKLSQIHLSNIQEQAIKQLYLKWTPTTKFNFDLILSNALTQIQNEN